MSVIDSLSLGGTTYSLRDNDGRAIIAGTESSTTSAHAYSAGDYFILNDTLYEATAAIAVGGTITVGTNCQATTVCGEVGQIKSDFANTLNGGVVRSNLSDTYQSDQINVLSSTDDLNDCIVPNVYRTSVGTLHSPTSNAGYHVLVFVSKWIDGTRKAVTQIAITAANTQKVYTRTASINASNVVSWDNSGNWSQVSFDLSNIASNTITRDKLSNFYAGQLAYLQSGSNLNDLKTATVVRSNAGVTNNPDSTHAWLVSTQAIPWATDANPRFNLIERACRTDNPAIQYFRLYDSGGGGSFTDWYSLTGEILKSSGINGLSGKKIVLMGDSTYAITGSDNGGHIAQILASIGDCTVYDCSFGGTRMSDSRGDGSSDTYKYFDFPKLVDAIIADDFTNQNASLDGKGTAYTLNLATLKSVDWSEVDVLCIEYGANDFASSVPLGNYTSDRTTYTGAFIYCMNALLTEYPNLHIVADGIRFRNWASEGTGMTAFNYENSLSLKTKDYIEALETVSASYGIPFFENLFHYGWNIYNWEHYFGTSEAHFNTYGTKYAANALYKNLLMCGFAQNL